MLEENRIQLNCLRILRFMEKGSNFDHLVDKSEVQNVADADNMRVQNQNFLVFSYASPQASQKCNISAIKIRGAFATQDEAFKHAEFIQTQDKNFDVWVMDMWKWCPFPPDEQTNTTMHYEAQSEKLAELMSQINAEKSGRNRDFIARLDSQTQSQ